MHQTFHPLFINYCSFFNGNADYFECHEELEELWKEVAPGEKQHTLVGLIQIATALYHWRRENFRGASKSMASAIRLVEQATNDVYIQSFQKEQLLASCRLALQRIQDEQPYVRFLLPIANEQLTMLVQAEIAKLPEQDAHFIMHKHTLRDRSDVIEARKQQLLNRK